jgi:hypothetical protein
MTVTENMIVRTWSATATHAGAREYHRDLLVDARP